MPAFFLLAMVDCDLVRANIFYQGAEEKGSWRPR